MERNIPVYAAGTLAGAWRDPLPSVIGDCWIIISAGDGTAVICWLSAAEGQPALHFQSWSELMRLGAALRQQGRGDVLTFRAAARGDAEYCAILARIEDAVRSVRAAFGPPGDHGYSTPQGRALCELYDQLPAVRTAMASASGGGRECHSKI